MTTDEQRVKLLAASLARHFRKDDIPMACACTGLTGICLACSYWWELFLREYDADDFHDMVTLFQVAREMNSR
jgi:hypothetical protein